LKIGSISANTTDDQLEKLVLNAHKTLPMPVKIIIRKSGSCPFARKIGQNFPYLTVTILNQSKLKLKQKLRTKVSNS